MRSSILSLSWLFRFLSLSSRSAASFPAHCCHQATDRNSKGRRRTRVLHLVSSFLTRKSKNDRLNGSHPLGHGPAPLARLRGAAEAAFRCVSDLVDRKNNTSRKAAEETRSKPKGRKEQSPFDSLVSRSALTSKKRHRQNKTKQSTSASSSRRSSRTTSSTGPRTSSTTSRAGSSRSGP